MKQPPTNAQEAASVIGYYFLSFFNNNYEATCKHLNSLHITDIEMNGESITIKSARPGLLIGRKGIHADGICALFSDKQVKIEESFAWSDYMMPHDPADYFE